MLNPQGLLDVARDLARLDPHRPRQASLRRAVSTAYYALFHLLIRSAQDVLTHVAQTDQAFRDWEDAAADPFWPIFLLLMLT